MGKKAKCLADGGVIGGDGLTDAQRAKINGARASLGISDAPPAAPQPEQRQQQAQALPQQQGIGAGIVGILKGRQQQIDKAAGYAAGGIINDAAEYWANDNAEFEKTNPGFVDRVIRGVNPLTGFGSAMGAMHTAAGNGDIPGMAMAGIQAIPAVGVLRAIPAAGAMKASVAPSLAKTAGAVAGGAVANAAADEYQKRADKNYQAGGIVRGKGGVDNVPMEISGTKVNLTGGKLPEAVLPGKTVQALGGPAAVESLIEATNGKPPVRDGLKEGGSYADGLVIDENDPRLKPFGPPVPSLGSGLSGMSRTIASSGVAPYQAVGQGRDTNGTITAESAAAAAGNPMNRSGGISGGIDMAGVNGILARENKARGEMIDSMVKANGGNGVAISQSEETLPGGISVRDWNDRVSSGFNTGMTPSQKAAYLAQEGGQNIQARGQDLASQQAMVRDTITARGQDLQNERAAAHDKVIMRGQDISGANDAIRAGIDQKRLGIVEADSKRAGDKWGIERGILQGQAADAEAVRGARAELNAALASGDQAKIEAAKAKATAAGIKFERPNNEFSAVTDPMGTNITRVNKDTGAIDIIDPKTGKMNSIAAPGAQPAAIPTPDKREIGKVYQTPKGALVWRGNGWEAAR